MTRKTILTGHAEFIEASGVAPCGGAVEKQIKRQKDAKRRSIEITC
jgi:hypothetical protein